MASSPSLLIFDPYAGGHHAEHVRHIMRSWNERSRPGGLLAAVSPHLTERHPDLLDYAAAPEESGHQRSDVALVEVPEAPALEGETLLQIGLLHRRILRRLVETHRPDHVLLLYLDHAQLALAAGLRFAYPVRFSGILFRPSFHYGRFEATTPSFRERLTRLRKSLLLRAALRNPHVDTVFSLDPTAVPAIQQLATRARAVALPDPVAPEAVTEKPEPIRARYGIEPDRKLLLLFGALDERKGVLQTLQAIRNLPDQDAQRIALLLAGTMGPAFHERVAPLLRDTRAESNAQIVWSDGFVPDDQLQPLLAASDLILVPYQRHVGSSGVLIRAAAAGRPVLGQEYGVVGWQIKEHGLGQALDTTNPTAIARGLQRFLAAPDAHFLPERAAAFAQANSVEAYLDTLFRFLPPRTPQ